METAAGFDSAKYDDWIGEELSDKPAKARAFLRCVYETGVDVLDSIDGIPTSSLSLFVYLPKECARMYRQYEPLLLCAGADPDRFIRDLPRKLEEISRYIRKNSRYTELFGLYAEVSKNRIDFSVGGIQTQKKVAFAYERLLLATYDCLAPAEYDKSRLLCGRSTDGELLYRDRVCPYAGEILRLALRARGEQDGGGQLPDPDARRLAGELGHTGSLAFADLSAMRAADAFQREQTVNLSPFINEYTYDMLPDGEKYNMDTRALEAIIRLPSPDSGTAAPVPRTGTLPTNGIRYDFSYDPRIPEEARIRSLFLKEILLRDRFVALFKFRSPGQDICGYYDLGDQMFYSPFWAYEDAREYRIAWNILYIVPYLYEASTGPDGGRLIQNFGERFHAAADPEDEIGYPVSVTPHPLGGELRNTYADRGEPAEREDPRDGGGDGRPRRTIQGYIRKLAPGDLPSGKDRARAKRLGFSLAEDEVYVEPFLG